MVNDKAEELGGTMAEIRAQLVAELKRTLTPEQADLVIVELDKQLADVRHELRDDVKKLLAQVRRGKFEL